MMNDLQEQLQCLRSENEDLLRQCGHSDDVLKQRVHETIKSNKLSQQLLQSQQANEKLQQKSEEDNLLIAKLRQEIRQVSAIVEQYKSDIRDLDEKVKAANVTAAQEARRAETDNALKQQLHETVKRLEMSQQQLHHCQQSNEKLQQKSEEDKQIILKLSQEVHELTTSMEHYKVSARNLDEKLRSANVVAAQRAKQIEVIDTSGSLLHENKLLFEQIARQEQEITALRREILPLKQMLETGTVRHDPKPMDMMFGRKKIESYPADIPFQKYPTDQLSERHELVMQRAKYTVQQSQPLQTVTAEAASPINFFSKPIPLPTEVSSHRSRVLQAASRAGLRRMPSPEPTSRRNFSLGVSRLLEKYRGRTPREDGLVGSRKDRGQEVYLSDWDASPRPDPQVSVFSLGRLIHEADDCERIPVSILKKHHKDNSQKTRPSFGSGVSYGEDEVQYPYSERDQRLSPNLDFAGHSIYGGSNRSYSEGMSTREKEIQDFTDDSLGLWEESSSIAKFTANSHDRLMNECKVDQELLSRLEIPEDLKPYSTPSAKNYADRLIERYIAGLRR